MDVKPLRDNQELTCPSPFRNPIDEFLDAWDKWVVNNPSLTGQGRMTLDGVFRSSSLSPDLFAELLIAERTEMLWESTETDY